MPESIELAPLAREALKPILKWAGGKRWLVPVLQELFPSQIDRLVEPFAGGLAVSLGLVPQKALINDANPHLINFYQQIQKGLHLNPSFKNEKKCYYQCRKKFNQWVHQKKAFTPQGAALFYFLIRTGFNGLCRFNNSGEFNVPFGQHKTIHYQQNFAPYQQVFKPWHFQHGDFEALCLQETDLIYADPPYDVPFTKYHRIDFTWKDQQRLAHWLSEHAGPKVVSNQATDRILSLYQKLGFKCYLLKAPRFISCTGDRKPALELLAFHGFKAPSLRKIHRTLSQRDIVGLK